MAWSGLTVSHHPVSFLSSYLEGLIFPPLRGLDRFLVDLVVVVGLGPAGVGGGADEPDEDDQDQDDDEEMLRLRELGVGDPRDAQTRDNDANDLQEKTCQIKLCIQPDGPDLS